MKTNEWIVGIIAGLVVLYLVFKQTPAAPATVTSGAPTTTAPTPSATPAPSPVAALPDFLLVNPISEIYRPGIVVATVAPSGAGE